MSNPEELNSQEPTEAQIIRGSAVLKVFMDAGWLRPMNPEDFDVISYAVQHFSGAPGTHEDIEDSPKPWQIIEEGTKALIEEHLAGQTALSEAQSAAIDRARSSQSE